MIEVEAPDAAKSSGSVAVADTLLAFQVIGCHRRL
jgi:hypothetical protein